VEWKPAAMRSDAVLLLTLAALAVGCGGAREESGPAPDPPACAGAGTAIERPRGLPEDLPLPPGTVLRSQQRPFPGQLVVRGVVPASIEDAASFFVDELENAGYALGRGDAEPGEREALFTGHGFRGGWRVNAIPNCEAVNLTLVVIRQPTG